MTNRPCYFRFLSLVFALCLVAAFVSGCAAQPEALPETEPTVTEPTQPQAQSHSFLNGDPLGEFSIVYSEADHDYSKRAAEYIQAQILERTGLELPLIRDTDPTAAYEIVVGQTSREISSRLTPPELSTQFAILAEDSQIALEGEYFVIAAAAYYFIETYVPQDDYDAQIPLSVTIHEPIVEKADNYIFLIGDGMGVNTTRLFEAVENTVDYGDGESCFYGYYLPYQGFSRTASLSGVTDSAAGGTALACGIKTVNYYVGQDENHSSVQSLTELAGEFEMSTAVMSTETETGATPGAFSAHADDRDLSTDILLSQQELQKKYGTIIECGFDFYTPNYMKWIEKTFLETLDTLDDNENGFFIMYEEAHTDKHGHNNDMDKAFQALVRFDQVIARAMEYAFYHPNTFVLITADHETGGITEENGTFVYTTEEHTGVDVPVFVYGYGGEVFHGNTVENIQIPQTIALWLGEPAFGDQTQFGPLTSDAP